MLYSQSGKKRDKDNIALVYFCWNPLEHTIQPCENKMVFDPVHNVQRSSPQQKELLQDVYRLCISSITRTVFRLHWHIDT